MARAESGIRPQFRGRLTDAARVATRARELGRTLIPSEFEARPQPVDSSVRWAERAAESDESDVMTTVARRARKAATKMRLFGAPEQQPSLRIGRYLVTGHVATGGGGEVLAGYDPELDRRVAIKLLRREVGFDTTRHGQHLVREARLLARLNHPNVVQVYEVGDHEGERFIAMQFVRGQTLRKWAADRSPREIVGAYLQAGRGLHALHEAGLVHRDFKPDNVMVGDDGSVVVTDLGLAKVRYRPASSSGGSSLSRFEAVLRTDDVGTLQCSSKANRPIGTPRYMAPEQLFGAPATIWSDLFAFCIALYEAIEGEHPFGGDTAVELRQRYLTPGVVPRPPRRMSAAVWKVVRKGLQPHVEKRPEGMQELLERLARTQARVRPVHVVAIVAAVVGIAAALGVPTKIDRAELRAGVADALLKLGPPLEPPGAEHR